MSDQTIYRHMVDSGLTRRDFMRYCAGLVGLMGLTRLPPVPGYPAAAARRDDLTLTVARALQATARLPVIWLAFQDCAGCTEALTRTRNPTVVDLLTHAISLEYHETLGAAVGHDAEAARAAAMSRFAGAYLLVVEGAVPALDGGYCTVGGRDATDILREAAAGAAAIVATGSCASFGGIPRARPNLTDARGVAEVLAGQTVVNIPGCPAIPEVTAGVIAHYITFGQAPELDSLGRPVTFYGDTVHAACPRRPHFLNDEFAQSFDDEGARQGWCLLELGCRGPETHNACSSLGWSQGLSSPVRAGHPCLGCAEPGFWDNGSFYPWQPRPYDAFLPWAVRGR